MTERKGSDRRSFLRNGLLLTLPVVSTASLAGRSLGRPTSNAIQVSLREKFLGCIVGCHVGSAMGAPCEGWTWQRIQQEHGTIDRLMPYEHYGNGWQRLPGTTEDGVERQKLMITAIIEKKDRVTAEDVRKIWVRDISPQAPGMVSEPFEARLLAMAQSGIPASDIGKYCDYAGLVSMARSCHPIGLINAGDPMNAVADVFEVGQLYQTTNSRGLQWAAITGLAIATATKPRATVDSVIAAVLEGDQRFANVGGGRSTSREIERGLKRTADCKDFREMREVFDGIYSGRGTPYPYSSANEIVTKAICIVRMVRGDTRDAMIAGVNFGRDTDCLTSIAAGISGALSGASSIPEEWIKQVDIATTQMRITNSRRTLREHADGLYEAYTARLRRMRAFIDEMEKA